MHGREHSGKSLGQTPGQGIGCWHEQGMGSFGQPHSQGASGFEGEGISGESAQFKCWRCASKGFTTCSLSKQCPTVT